jgi:hypothetical protein
MLVREATTITGGLGKPSKMPGYSYGLPAMECMVGSRLREVPGSTCAGCYALKGKYIWSPVQRAQYKRLESIPGPQWVEAMVTLIAKRCESVPYFRWHDSGDIQSLEHLGKIVEVAKQTPAVNHWLPTREYKIVKLWRQLYGSFPDNLTVRLSAHMVDGEAPDMGMPTSTVVREGVASCPAPTQGNKCESCRACWDSGVSNVAYKWH